MGCFVATIEECDSEAVKSQQNAEGGERKEEWGVVADHVKLASDWLLRCSGIWSESQFSREGTRNAASKGRVSSASREI